MIVLYFYFFNGFSRVVESFRRRLAGEVMGLLVRHGACVVLAFWFSSSWVRMANVAQLPLGRLGCIVATKLLGGATCLLLRLLPS